MCIESYSLKRPLFFQVSEGDQKTLVAVLRVITEFKTESPFCKFRLPHPQEIESKEEKYMWSLT